MTIIKRFINWIIELLKKLFKVHKKDNKSVINEIHRNNINKKNGIINASFDESLPSYMIISDKEKEKLIYSISLMVNLLLETNTKKKEIEEAKLVKYIKEKYNINTMEIIDQKYLETLIKDLNTEEKDDIINKFQLVDKQNNDFKIYVDEVNKVIDLINNNDISIIEENKIEKEISTIVNDKNIIEGTEQKIDYFSKNVCDIIDVVDKDFLKEVVKEYNVINYVTVSTMIVDKKIEEFNKLQDDFKHHRFNRFYYEREINRIKHELNQIRNLKNKKEVNIHIEKLKKELYTKSKDKYDLLYNNEVFMNFNKECEILLDKINAKVVDIKKEPKEEVKKEDDKKNEYLENILKRFHDMEIARKLILLSQIEDIELVNDPKYDFVNEIVNKYEKGVEEEFNFDRNKKKTELVIFFNELNLAINKINKEPFIPINHINFRMNDLTEAVDVRKKELGNLLKTDLYHNLEEKDNKIKKLINKTNNKGNKKM